MAVPYRVHDGDTTMKRGHTNETSSAVDRLFSILYCAGGSLSIVMADQGSDPADPLSDLPFRHVGSRRIDEAHHLMAYCRLMPNCSQSAVIVHSPLGHSAMKRSFWSSTQVS
jgi:hypothetical protein